MIAIANQLQHAPSTYMQRLYFDAISYHPTILQSLVNLVGPERILFGTDNPFFPPLNVPNIHEADWPSTVKVQSAIDSLENSAHRDLINSGNALRLFNLV
jgi:aminocarboxymuconate-semialdehyde decarboxylase